MTVLVPYVIEKSGREERAMDIYSRLLKDRIVFLGSQVNDAVANSLVDEAPSIAAPGTSPYYSRRIAVVIGIDR